MNTALESKLLARNGRSTALEVYGVEPNTRTRYFFGAAEQKTLLILESHLPSSMQGKLILFNLLVNFLFLFNDSYGKKMFYESRGVARRVSSAFHRRSAANEAALCLATPLLTARLSPRINNRPLTRLHLDPS